MDWSHSISYLQNTPLMYSNFFGGWVRVWAKPWSASKGHGDLPRHTRGVCEFETDSPDLPSKFDPETNLHADHLRWLEWETGGRESCSRTRHRRPEDCEMRMFRQEKRDRQKERVRETTHKSCRSEKEPSFVMKGGRLENRERLNTGKESCNGWNIG